MKERKYKEQFKTVVRIDPKTGKDVREAVYTGKYHPAPKGGAALLAAWVVAAIGLFAFFLGNTPETRCIYVLPFASMALIPLFYGFMGAVCMCMYRQKITVVQLEKGAGRCFRSGIGTLVLCVMTLAGCVFFGAQALSYVELAISASAAFFAFFFGKKEYEREKQA